MANIRPPARLEPRAGDEVLTIEQLEQISLFENLSRQPDLEQYPGAIVLRRFSAGDVICRQNEPGWTAFYTLTSKDLLELRENQLQAERARSAPDSSRIRNLEADVAALAVRYTAPGAAEETVTLQPAATVHVTKRSDRPAGIRGMLKSLFRGAQKSEELRSNLWDGELFGEMSCLYRTPRTATVIAARDVYMLEFLRHILDKMYSNANKAFKEQVDNNYRKRVLELHVRNLAVFNDLTPEQFNTLRDRVELVDCEPGELVCDEHDQSDSMYLIRNGLIKVVKHASFLLGTELIEDWNALAESLQAESAEASAARRRLWQLLPPAVQARVRIAATGAALTSSEKDQLLYALNDLIKQPKFSAHADFKDAIAAAGLQDEVKKLPANPRKWAQHQQVRSCHRKLLEAILGDSVPRLAATARPSRILSYRSQGDFIGEMGLFRDKPRSATCVAYDHPESSKFGRVELVRISKELFDDMRWASRPLEERIRLEVDRRLQNTRDRLSTQVWDVREPVALSPRFDELGLIQGQKLMLIDLDRCTRCDKCVEACVRSHPDHRSRLFLDGPRFQDFDGEKVRNYLVPTTCRMCKDPICLIGCPVGSIHKGDTGQIVIENWCIGCGRCAQQCPYGSIQMHRLGLIPREARGWFYRPGTQGPWQNGRAPFHFDRDLRARHAQVQEFQFQFRFDLPARVARESKSFHLQVHSAAARIEVSLNGSPVAARTPADKPKLIKDKGEEWNLEARLCLAGSKVTEPLQPVLRVGQNTIMATVSTTAKETDVLFECGLYAVAQPSVPQEFADNMDQELVMNLAVVCDMCGDQWGAQPACVNACPHDAALRVDARPFFKAD